MPSKMPRNVDAIMTVTITTKVAVMVSFRVGQETFISSVTHSDAKVNISSLRQATKTAAEATMKEMGMVMYDFGLPK